MASTPEQNKLVKDLLVLVKKKEYYAILGITKAEFSEDSLKKAYRKQALLFHPDKNSVTAICIK